MAGDLVVVVEVGMGGGWLSALPPTPDDGTAPGEGADAHGVDPTTRR